MFHHGDIVPRSFLSSHAQITLYNGHNFADESMQQELKSTESSIAAPFTVNSTSYVSLSPSSTCPAVWFPFISHAQLVVFTPMRNGEGMLAYFADKSRTQGNHLALQLNRRMLNCNQAFCEWNKAGDRAVVTVSNDVDQVERGRVELNRRPARRTTAAISFTICSTTSSSGRTCC